MAKLPAFQFYPGDWMKDPGVRRCSHAARGVWIDMLCLMFECGERGVLISGDIPWSREDAAAAVGGNLDVTLRLIDELVAKGVCAVREDDALYSKRMVRDETERTAARERKRTQRQKESGGPPSPDHSTARPPSAAETPVTHDSSICPDDVTPMSQPPSTSVSSSTSKKKPPPSISADSPGAGSAPPSKPLWMEEVEGMISEMGVEDHRCLSGAINGGLGETEIRAVIAYFAKHWAANGWGPEALHYRLRSASQQTSEDRGWPKVSQQAERARQRESEQEEQSHRRAEEQEKKAQAAQSYEQLEQDYGAKLDAMSFKEKCSLARSVSPFLEKQLKKLGDCTTRSLRGPMLGKLLGKSRERPVAEEGSSC